MGSPTSQATNNREAMAIIKRLYDAGKITRDEAKLLAEPVLDRINLRAVEIAKQHGKRPFRLDFINAIRNSY